MSPEDYFACEVAGEPVLLARPRDGRLAAFSNVCRHRFPIIVPGQGSGPSLRCPYHNWTSGLDGRLLSQPEFENVQDWDKSQVCLQQYRVEAWRPFVFVNQHPAAPGLLEVLGAIPAKRRRSAAGSNSFVSPSAAIA